jgi:hypothetical protein
LKDSVIQEACKTRAEHIDLHNFIAKGFQQRQEMMCLQIPWLQGIKASKKIYEAKDKFSSRQGWV